MPSLIGTSPNQVPVNAMLGSAAYQDVNNFAVETKTFGDNSDFAASTKFVQTVKSSLEEIVLTTGTGSAYVCTLTNPPAAYYNGFTITVSLHTQSTVNAPTLNVNGLGAAQIWQSNTDQLDTGNVNLASAVYTLRYFGSRFYIVQPSFANSAKLTAGTDTTTAITPKGLRTALNASGFAPIYACRAWVNFNGTGTVAIKSSGNVSSVTDLGVGKYQLNFTTSLEDVNYSWSGSASLTLASDSNRILVDRREDMTKTTSALAVRTMAGGTTADPTDSADVSVQVFR